MKIEDIEASLVRHLYENLTVTYGITILEDITEKDPTDVKEWVVIDSLTNPLGAEPVQHWFLYLAIQKEAPNSKQKLNVLTDRVKDIVDIGTTVNLYSYSTGELLGSMCISDSSLSQTLTHRSGGMMRTLAISATY